MQTSSNAVNKRNSIDMTEGSIIKHLLYFSAPLAVGYLCQLLYNMVDTWVVGNYVSTAAFSAVGSTGTVTNIITGLFMGFSSGAGVVIAQFFGAGDHKRLEKAIHTTAVLAVILAVAFTFIGLAMMPVMLNVLNMPSDVEKEAKIYLTITLAGTSTVMIYNMGAGILRAIGDSKRPFYFLIISAFTNLVLDLLLVIVFKMGVAGVAVATVISQGISAILVTVLLFRTKSVAKLSLKKMCIDPALTKLIFRIGIPTSLQIAITSFSNVFLHSYINFFGKEVMGGFTAYNKIDSIVILPMETLGVASSVFVGQNLGKGDVKRAKKGANISFLLSALSTLVLVLPIAIFSKPLVAVFNSDPEVIEYGSMFVKYLAPFIVFWCANQIYSGALRGSGKSLCTMIITLSSFVAFRQIYLFIVTRYISNTVMVVMASYPLGWILAFTLTVIFYNVLGLENKKNSVTSVK